MAKFCRHCGTPLEDEQVCSCAEAQAELNAPPTQSAQPSQAAQVASQATAQATAALKGLVPVVKSYLASPVQATQTALTGKDTNNAVILLVIQVIAAGLFLFSFLSKICSSVMDALKSIVSMRGSISDLASLPKVEASLLFSLLYGALMAAVGILLCMLLVFAVSKLCHANTTFGDALIACGMNSIYVTVLLLLGFLVSFVSLPIAMLIFLAVIFACCVMSVLSASALAGPQQVHGIFWICLIVGLLLVFLVTMAISFKFFFIPAVGEISAKMNGVAITVKEAMGELIANLPDINELFQEIFSEIAYRLY